jgi:hypothetical protein
MSYTQVDNVTVPLTSAGADTWRVAERRGHHWWMLGISTVIVICAFAFETDAGGRVGPTWLSGVTLPELCGSRVLFRIECPGCGLTRSFIALAHGDLAASLAYHRVGWLLALAVLLQFPYRALALRDLRMGIVERNWPTWCGWALIVALVGNWLGNVANLF